MCKKVCLSARVPRDSPTETGTTAVADSSESSEESLDQMARNIQKFLNPKDADDVRKIVGDISSAKDPEQTVDGYVRIL